MNLLTRAAISELVSDPVPPCISIYQTTHRRRPENQQDPIRFKNLLRTVEQSLRTKYPGREVRPLLERFQKLAGDTPFWNHTLEGLAVLGGPETFRVFQLQRPVKELGVAADSFHVKPLLRYIQSADRFQVLCLTRQTAMMYEGNRYVLDPLDPEDFPATMTDALGEERTGRHQTVASYGGVGAVPSRHGHGSRKDEIDKDTERYFRAVDREVAAQFSKPSGLPLVLVALPEHQPVFRRVSQNRALLEGGVSGNPEAMSEDQLRTAVWQAVEPQYLARLSRLTDTFQHAAAHQKGTADLADAARAAAEGRVATLLVEGERVIAGRLDRTTGAIRTDDMVDPDVGDLLDDLAESVLRTGGDVVVVPKERMPTTTGLAATFNY